MFIPPPAGAGGFAGRAREGQFDWVEDVYKTGISVIEVGDRVSGALFRSVASLLDARTYIHSFKTLGTAAGETAGSEWLVVSGERTFAQEFPTTHRTVTDPAAQFEAMVKAPGGEWYDPQIWVENPVEAATFTLETAASVAPQAALMAYGMAPAAANSAVAAGTANLGRAAGRAVGRGLDGAGEALFGPPAAVAVTPNGAMVVVPLAQESGAVVSAGAAASAAAGAGGRVANIGVATGAAVCQMSATRSSSGGLFDNLPFARAKFRSGRRGTPLSSDQVRYNALLDQLDGKNYGALTELEGVVGRLLDRFDTSQQAIWLELRRRLEATRKSNPQGYTRRHVEISARIEQELDRLADVGSIRSPYLRPDFSRERPIRPPQRAARRDAVSDLRPRDEVGEAMRDIRRWGGDIED